MRSVSLEEECVARVLCKSGKFETGEGTCAPICMSRLGDARKRCQYIVDVHGELAKEICVQLGVRV